MMQTHAVYNLGHVLNEWREHGRDVRGLRGLRRTLGERGGP